MNLRCIQDWPDIVQCLLDLLFCLVVVGVVGYGGLVLFLCLE